MNFYAVTAKCGHVGRNHYIPIEFGVIAENGREAASIARLIPRVKHDRKDAIINVRKVDEVTFQFLRRVNDCDPYLLCRSKKEQAEVYDSIAERIISDEEEYESETAGEPEGERAYFIGKKKLRNPHKCYRYFDVLAA